MKELLALAFVYPSGSVRAESVAVSHLEQTLSDLASSSIGEAGHQANWESRTLKLQAQIWMNLSKYNVLLSLIVPRMAGLQLSTQIFPKYCWKFSNLFSRFYF